jgi:hypothetical protein
LGFRTTFYITRFNASSIRASVGYTAKYLFERWFNHAVNILFPFTGWTRPNDELTTNMSWCWMSSPAFQHLFRVESRTELESVMCLISKKKTPDRVEIVDPKTAIELLQRQIEEAKQMLENRPIRPKEHKVWNNEIRKCLMKIYGPLSPNIPSIVEAPGHTAVWKGMSRETSEKFDASSIENKIRLLQSCIVALNLIEGRTK